MKSLLLIFCLNISIGFGQEDDVINIFNGGNIGLSGKFKIHSLLPPGGLNLGTSSGFVAKSPELVFFNAAAMANIYEPKLSIDITPPSIKLLNTANEAMDEGFEGEIESSLDEELESYKPSNDTKYIFPTITFDEENTLSVNSLSFVLPINDFRIGLGFYQSVDMGLRFMLSGMSLQLDHVDPENSINELSFILQNEMVFNLQMSISEQVISSAYRVNDQFNVGISYFFQLMYYTSVRFY